MSDPNWHPTWTDTVPASQPRCPPCTGDCCQGRRCPARARVLSRDPRSEAEAHALLEPVGDDEFERWREVSERPRDAQSSWSPGFRTALLLVALIVAGVFWGAPR